MIRVIHHIIDRFTEWFVLYIYVWFASFILGVDPTILGMLGMLEGFIIGLKWTLNND